MKQMHEDISTSVVTRLSIYTSSLNIARIMKNINKTSHPVQTSKK